MWSHFIYYEPSASPTNLSTVSLSVQRLYRPWRGKSATRSSWLRSTVRCPPSSSRGRRSRTPTPTPKCWRTWATLQRPWRLRTKTCKRCWRTSQTVVSLLRLLRSEDVGSLLVSSLFIIVPANGPSLVYILRHFCIHAHMFTSSLPLCGLLQGHRQSRRSDGRNHRTAGSGSRNLRCNFQTGRVWRGLRRGENTASVLGVLMDPGTIRVNRKC